MPYCPVEDAHPTSGDEIELWDGLTGKDCKITSADDLIEEAFDGLTCFSLLFEFCLVIFDLLGCDAPMTCHKDGEDVHVFLIDSGESVLLKHLCVSVRNGIKEHFDEEFVYCENIVVFSNVLFPFKFDSLAFSVCCGPTVLGIGEGTGMSGQGFPPDMALYMSSKHATKMSPNGLCIDACVFTHVWIFLFVFMNHAMSDSFSVF